MKKIISIITLLGFLALLVWVLPVKAVEERPKGLEDKGPLTKITFIHYKREHAKPAGVGKDRGGSACYGYLASGAKWKTTEDYLINPTNSGQSDSFVQSGVDSGVAEWERYGGGGIFGSGSVDSTAPYISSTTDNKNVVAFGVYPDANVIAVTNVWGYFSGPPRTRELVEWDMLFNTGFTWGDASVNSALMDLQNIATHELGHSAGMADLYTTSCNLETMYGYSTEGEMIKRDLNNGDITGIRALYR